MKVILFYGQSGVGKTTLATLLRDYLQKKKPNAHIVHFDGDGFRKHKINFQTDYTDAGRIANLSYLLSKVYEQKKASLSDDHYLILSFVCPFLEVRMLLQRLVEKKSLIQLHVQRNFDLIDPVKQNYQLSSDRFYDALSIDIMNNYAPIEALFNKEIIPILEQNNFI